MSRVPRQLRRAVRPIRSRESRSYYIGPSTMTRARTCLGTTRHRAWELWRVAEQPGPAWAKAGGPRPWRATLESWEAVAVH